MKKILLVSGDSFTDRNFRSASHPEMDVSWPMWPEILAKKLDMRLINLGRSGQGNEYIYSSLQDTIERIEDKSEIGMVIAAWSQSFRKDYQHNHSKGHEYVFYDYGQWTAERVNPNGDIFGWIRKSLRTYKNLEYMCERYNIPYVQTQMIPLYIDWLRGLMPTEQEEAMGKVRGVDDTVYPGDAELDINTILQIIMEYDDIINHNNFLGWPISRDLGGYPLSIKEIGLSSMIDRQHSPYVISKYDGHPNAEGHKRLAAAIYKFIKEK